MRGLASALVGLLLCGPAAAAEPLTARIIIVDRWLEAVRAHDPGHDDAAAYAMAALPNLDIKNLWLDVQTLMRFVRCATCGSASVQVIGSSRRVAVGYTRPELAALRTMADEIRVRDDGGDRTLKRAAILHADVARLLNPESVAPPSGFTSQPEHIMVRGLDGRQERVVDLALHWDIGRALLSLVGGGKRPGPQQDPTVRLWYLATMAYLGGEAIHDSRHFSSALDLFPDDPVILFHNGCLRESLATPRVQRLLRTASLPTGLVVDIKDTHAELQLAEKHFRRAVELDAGFAEARLHHGRVLGLLGRHGDAAAELRQLPADLAEPRLNYYAALFLGGEEEALGRADAARDAYSRAAALFPEAQSPALALSHLARQSGDRATAIAQIQRVLGLPPEAQQRNDPLWAYDFMQGRVAEELFEALYQPFRQKASQ